MARSSVEVIDELFKVMKDVVRDYPSGVRKIESRSELVPVTAFFPGGYGLWRGERPPFKDLPTYFPIRPVMFVSHAFLSDVYKAGERGEWHTTFWGKLRDHYLDDLESNGIRLQQCFFTNVFMGLNPDATGDMPRNGEFEKQCRDFFVRQVKIVDPKMIVALGRRVSKALEGIGPPRVIEVYSPTAYLGAGSFSSHRKLIAEAYAGVP